MVERLPEDRPIGIFDSGVGGLTVLRALHEHLPKEALLYLGDTARLPYGTKSPETVRRYALQAAERLVDRGVKMLVIACNTASAVGLGDLQRHFAPLPVIGVVDPGARAAIEASRGGRILVIATEGTVRGGAYSRAIRRLWPAAEIESCACPLFVALAEEGWTEGPVTEGAVHRYLASYFPEVVRGAVPSPEAIDVVVLACTHFPVLRNAIADVVGVKVALVDCAETTARAVASALMTAKLLRRRSSAAGTIRFLATDAPDRFCRVGALFRGATILPDEVELVDL